MSAFEISLHLIDFSLLERLLSLGYRPSHKGQVPFHPVSMFLACCLRRELGLSWRQLARLLASKHGAYWRWLFGFRKGDTPSASGLRHFLNAVPPEVFAEFCPRCIDLLCEQGLCPQRSTYPGDPTSRGVTFSEDGMLHPARHQHTCQLATDACFQPVVPERPQASPHEHPLGHPQPAAGRPCRAREHALEGCHCDTPACDKRCQRASSLDPEARFVHYDGHNKHPRSQTEAKAPGDSDEGINVFGYRSLADLLLDDRFGVAWVAQSYLQPAHAAESTRFPERLLALHTRFPDLQIGEFLGDAALGYPQCLEALYDLGALRLIDIRADDSDDDPERCLQRGYDGRGHPLCAHGYPLHYNGYDEQRQRAKWVCRQACRRVPRREGEDMHPVEGCPYLDPERPLGQVVNVGRALPDGCVRLAREVPYGSEAWKARYGRRNNSEARNSQIEGMGLKEMPSHGLERNEKETHLADFLINLRTLGRLVQEASALTPGEHS
jgi:hypothetical protein